MTADRPGATCDDPQVSAISARLHHGLVPVPDGTDTSVVGVWHRTFPLTAGVVDDRAVQAMTNGQCLALAAALNHRTGWPIVALMNYPYEDFEEPGYEPNRDDQMTHLGVLSPDGKTFVDICGARPVDDVVASYRRAFYGEQADSDTFGIQIVDAAWLEFMLQDPKMRRPAMQVAVTFVDAVLATVPALSCSSRC